MLLLLFQNRVSTCDGVTLQLCISLAFELLRPLQARCRRSMGSPPMERRYLVLL